MRPFSVGDKVFSLMYGECVIIAIDDDKNYPVNLNNEELFTLEGRFHKEDIYPTLFHIEDAKKRFPSYFFETYKPKGEKKKILLAPAICKSLNNYVLGRVLCHSVGEAKMVHEESFFRWPAIPNAEGYYEVEE